MAHDRDDPEDDAELFRTAIGPVRKSARNHATTAAPKPRPRARMAERDEAAALDEFRHALDDRLLEAGDVLAYRRDALPPRLLQRLKRGEIAVQDELDLHGADVREAEKLLRAFLARRAPARLRLRAHHSRKGIARKACGAMRQRWQGCRC